MKVLLDERIDRRLSKELPNLDVKTVPQMGWAGLKNGKLLSVAQEQFDVFITVDRNLSFQQPINNFNIAVVVLKAKSNRLGDLIPFCQDIVSIVNTLLPNTVTELE